MWIVAQKMRMKMKIKKGVDVLNKFFLSVYKINSPFFFLNSNPVTIVEVMSGPV